MISEDRKTAAGLEVVIVDLGEHGLPYHYATFRDPMPLAHRTCIPSAGGMATLV